MTSNCTPVLVSAGVAIMLLAGCASFEPVTPSTVEFDDQSTVAVLLFGFDVDITQAIPSGARLRLDPQARTLSVV